MSSDVSQGSVLRPLLFIICIDYVGVGILAKTVKLADDIKMGKNIIIQQDKYLISLQDKSSTKP